MFPFLKTFLNSLFFFFTRTTYFRCNSLRSTCLNVLHFNILVSETADQAVWQEYEWDAWMWCRTGSMPTRFSSRPLNATPLTRLRKAHWYRLNESSAWRSRCGRGSASSSRWITSQFETFISWHQWAVSVAVKRKCAWLHESPVMWLSATFSLSLPVSFISL